MLVIYFGLSVGPLALCFLQTVLVAFGGGEEDFWHLFIEFHCGIQKYTVAQNKPINGS